jgi:hypothetical protein
MKLPVLAAFLTLAAGPLWANPGVIENGDYKISLSETLPGVDDPNNPQAVPTITVGVVNKFNNTGMNFNLNLYAINNYYLLDDALILIGRTTPQWSAAPPEYSLLNLNLTTSQNSQEFKNLKRFSLSPDNQSVLVLVDGGGKPDLIGLIRLNNQPGRLEWLETGQAGVSLIQSALPGPVKSLSLSPAVGWFADALSAVLIVTADDGTQDAQGNPVLKNYLVWVELEDNGPKVSAEPLDLSPYHVKDGTMVDKVDCAADKVTLTFTQANSSETVQADFPLPTAAKP